MTELFEQDRKTDNRQSSKGNQLKWYNGNTWYKADYTGYEGLAEYMVSHLLVLSDLKKNDVCLYDTEQIRYKKNMFHGCKSTNFLSDGWQLITLERLFKNFFGESLMTSMYKITSYEERIKFMVDQIIRITGLTDFGKYVSRLITIDAFFLNEDRHTHNIAVLIDSYNQFHYCPFFDHGASLLSDTSMDYPLNQEVYPLMNEVKSKTFCSSFDEQLDIVEKLYGRQITFRFTKQEVHRLIMSEPYYPIEIKNRAEDILLYQMKKYAYLFL
jgi:hypothetical protein